MMKDSKEITAKKIQSIRSWLEKAEHSYEDDKLGKGDLALLLARAEMQHMEETQGVRRHMWSLSRLPMLCCFLTILLLPFISMKPKEVDVHMEVGRYSFFTSEGEPQVLALTAGKIQLPLVHSLHIVQKERTKELEAEHKDIVQVVKEIRTEAAPHKVILNENEIKQAVYDASRSMRGD